MATDDEPNDQREVLARKGNALKSGRGLQIWGPQAGDEELEAPGADSAGGHGNASMGTAERQAKGGYLADRDAEPDAEETGG